MAWERVAPHAGALPGPVLAELPRVLALSDFVARWAAAAPGRLETLAASGELHRTYEPAEWPQRVAAALEGASDPDALKRALRVLRNREMVRIAWRDLCGRAGLEETLRDLSLLADSVVDATLDRLHQAQVALDGEPRGLSGAAQRLFVIAMGKLGASELNFSSDIDLMLAYPEQGDTVGGRRSLSNQEFFTRLAKKLVAALGEVTAEGFVFRVDLRLRPFGDSGPVVLSVGAFESYYEAHARDWERYALIKARTIAGDRLAGDELLRVLRPFVYRRYIDFGALEALREMKAMVSQEVARRGLEADLKRGRGGIREVEFIAQCFQLIRGGREPALRTQSLFGALEAERELGLLGAQAVGELLESYRFLRVAEHRVQQVADQQTQSLPADELGRARIAHGMGYTDWEAFFTELERHRARVQAHFDELLSRPGRSAEARTGAGAEIWSDSEEHISVDALAAAGYDHPEQAAEALERLRASNKLRSLSPTARRRLDELMPKLIARATAGARPAETLARVLPLIENVATRSVYLALLNEHPAAVDQLLRLCSASPWVAKTIAARPMLLDELLDPRSLYAPPGAAALEADMRSRLARHAGEDAEHRLEVLRQFKNTQVLRVAAADIVGRLPLPAVSNHLSAIAETVVRAALALAWEDLAAKHGEPRCQEETGMRTAHLGVIAYGKLGGLELGYGSDLDLVFLHDSRGEGAQTDGPRPIDNNVFLTRVAQRVIHYLATLSADGRAYDVDTRLRPSGSSGLLVSSLEAFDRYQAESAWTWEHQALMRARPVAGERSIAEAFEFIRRRTLARARDPEALRRDLLDMRTRMRAELDRSDERNFDLKQGPGGMTDIEFVVQYAVLRWGAERPVLLDFTDNLRLLERLAGTGPFTRADCQALRDAYFTYRAAVHRCSLQERPALAPAEAFQAEREAVGRIWRSVVENP